MFYRTARLRRKMRQQETQQQGLEQMGWQQYIPVELLIGFLIVFWYMVAFLYQLGYKIYYHIPLMYMDYSFTRLLEPAMYISVSVVILIVLLCFIVKIKYSPRRYSILLLINFICILFLLILSPALWLFLLENGFYYEMELARNILTAVIPAVVFHVLSQDWVIISVITSFLILFSILFIIRFFSNVENGSVISIKSIPTTGKVLILVSALIFLLISAFLIGLFTAETKNIILVFNKTDETIIDGKKIKFERKYVVLDYYDKYYIVSPLKSELNDVDIWFGPEIELVKMEEEKESPIQVLNDPLQLQKNENKDHQIRLYEYNTGWRGGLKYFYSSPDLEEYKPLYDEPAPDWSWSSVLDVNANDVLEACVQVDAEIIGKGHEYNQILYEQPYLEFGLEFSIEDANHQILPQKMRVPLNQPIQCQTWLAPRYGRYDLKVVNLNKKIELLLKERKISENPYTLQTSLHVIGHKINE